MKPKQIYRFVGLNYLGQRTQGKIDAMSKTHAKIILHQQGFDIKKITPEYHTLYKWLKRSSISDQTILQFTKELSALLRAKMPMIQALNIIQEHIKHPLFSHQLCQIQNDIRQGLSLAQALKQHPKTFNRTYCEVIQAGEQSGRLITLLGQLEVQLYRQIQIQQKIRTSLIYPFAVIMLTCIITIGILWYVVPTFEGFFAQYQATLPIPTLALIFCAHSVRQYGWIAASLLGLCIMLWKQYAELSTGLMIQIDKWLLKLPWINRYIHQAVTTQIFQVLAVLLQAGYPLAEGLECFKDSQMNARYLDALSQSRQDIIEGQSFHHALKARQLFSNTIIQCIAIGEASGNLAEMTAHIATEQSDELQHRLERLLQLMEPLLMTGLGLWVGAIIFALYLPIFKLGIMVS